MVVTAPSTIAPPKELERLADLAYNLWWHWHADARRLYSDIDHMLWDSVNGNPVQMLHRLPPEAYESVLENPVYMRNYREVIARFDRETKGDLSQTWVGRHRPKLLQHTLAYFSAEFGLNSILPIYSGGLGVLAGDHIKEASDLGLPLVAVSLLYRQGYLSQRLNHDGWQQDVTADLEPWAEPTRPVLNDDGSPLIVEVELESAEHPLKLAVWSVEVGRVTLYLLDADVEGNPDWTRSVSSRLYGGDSEHRLRQELILGIGGVRALRAIGVSPTYWHANEGHAAFHMLERIRELVEDGATFAEAADGVRPCTIFTTHTPVPAGHDVFSHELMDRYFHHFIPQLGITRDELYALGQHGEGTGAFNMTALSMRLADHRNGVSEIHGDISRQMWGDIWGYENSEDVPIGSITNGVHLQSWMATSTINVLRRYFPSWRDAQSDPFAWDIVREIPDDVFWNMHLASKRSLFDLIRELSRRRWSVGGVDPGQVVAAGPFLEENLLTLGFARRFATYKRATLLFHDTDRLARILNNPERPVQIIWSGKAHPADEGGKRLIQEIFWRARDPRFGGRIAFAEDYDMRLAGKLVAGVDVWLNNPRAPLEASGTSGMKAAINGVPNLSILDGWWDEAWTPESGNGWGIEPSDLEGEAADAEEANLMYDLIEYGVVPAYYDRNFQGVPEKYVRISKESIRTCAPDFSARRMLIDYVNMMYAPAAIGEAPLPGRRAK
jgi:starch phosphorylase